MSRMRVALVHDFLTQRGGAERVVISLSRMFPGAPIYTSVYDPDGTYPDFGALDVRPLWLQRLPHRGNAFRALLPLYPAAFENLRLDGYDLVISSSSAFAHRVRPRGAAHVVYCYTPPRFLYDPAGYFGRGAPALPWARPLVAPVLAHVRRTDRRAARHPDLYVAISRAVAARIGAAYGRVALVIHPPLDLGRFAGVTARPRPGVPYFLVVARLLPYKRVDVAVEACTKTGRRLVVVGTGPAEARLRERAGPTVRFVPRASDAEVANWLAGCTAVIQAAEEDFGLMPLEANAVGRPAVAYAAGGAADTVVDGVTGVLFGEQSVDALVAALEAVEATAWDDAALRQHAAAFSEDRFHAELGRLLAGAGLGEAVDGLAGVGALSQSAAS